MCWFSDERSGGGEDGEMELSCCVECREKFRVEARDLQGNGNERASSRLPSWLKEESRRLNDKEKVISYYVFGLVLVL